MSAPTTAQVLTGLANTATVLHLNREVQRAISLNGHPTRPLTKTERAEAEAILSAQGCVPSEIQMRLGATSDRPGPDRRAAPPRRGPAQGGRNEGRPMRLPTTEREWLNAVQANRADAARAVIAGRDGAAEKLRQELGQLEANRPAATTTR